MRGKRITKWMAVLVAVTLTWWLASPTWAESGCHKSKGKGGKPGNVVAVQVI